MDIDAAFMQWKVVGISFLEFSRLCNRRKRCPGGFQCTPKMIYALDGNTLTL